jgi:hypothetical protein
MNIQEFCKTFDIPYNKITVILVPNKDGKLIKKPKYGDFNNMPLEEVLTRRQPRNYNNYSLYLKYTKQIFCVDFDYYKKDHWNNANEEDLIKCEIYKILKDDNCYHTKTKKGLHYYCIIKDVPDYSNEVNVYYNDDFEIDLIKPIKNMWEQKDRLVQGDKLSEFNFEDIKHLFNFNKSKSKTKTKTKTKSKTNKEYNNISISQYIINDYYFKEIISILDLSIYNDYFKFSVICKYLNRFDDWDKISFEDDNKKCETVKDYKTKYDPENNLKMWNSININKFENIIHKIIYIDLKHLEFANKIKFKPIMEILDRDYYKEGIFEKLSNHIQLDDENYIIQSCQGTGKTTLVKEAFKKDKKINFISIVSRVNLAYSHHNIFLKEGIKTQVYDNDFDNDNKKNYITTIESLHKIEYDMHLNKADISTYTLFLDEFQSLLEHLLESTTIKSRIEIWDYFCNFIKNCYNFYAVDADISDMCIDYLSEIRPDYKYIKNNFEHFKGVEAEEIFNEDELIEKCQEDIKNGQKFFICCDSEATSNYLKSKINSDELRIITSKHKMDKEFDLNKIFYLIFSPSIIYGLDDLQDRNIYCFYKEHTISPAQMVQQITRCRNIKKLFYFFNKKKYSTPRFNNIEECREHILGVEKYGIRRFKYFSKKDEYAELYTKLLTKHLYDKDCFETNKALHFQNYIKKRGFVIVNNYKIDNYRCKDKIIKEVFQKILNDNFNCKSEWVENANKYLGLKNEKDFIYYKEFFTDKKLLKDHFNIANYFFKNKKEIREDIKYKEGSDFLYNIFKKDKVKIDFLNKLKLKYDIKFDKQKLIISWDDYVNNEKIYNDYVKLFNVRTKKEFINNEYNCLLMIGDIFKKLFGKVIHKKAIKIKSTGEGARLYEFYLNNDDLIIHENLYNFRKPDKDDDKFKDDDIDLLGLDEPPKPIKQVYISEDVDWRLGGIADKKHYGYFPKMNN